MKKLVLLIAMTIGLSTASVAQVWIDLFSYGTGPTIGSWMEDRGNWNATSNQAEAEQVFSWQYCTQPNRLARDACVECDVNYNPASTQALQFGGVALRCNDPANDQDLIMVKIQDNNSDGSFDRMFLYDRPGAATWADTPSPTTSARIRLVAIDNDAMAFADIDGDGLWDLTVRRTVTTSIKAGPIGINGFGGVHIDNFAYFDAAIMPLASSPMPRPGATIAYKLRGTAGATYQVATSLGNNGISLPTGAAIPLALDPVFFASVQGTLGAVFQNYAGVMDGNGDANVSLFLPNIPALTGITLYTAFVNLAGGNFGAVSNDDQQTIQ